MNELYPCVACQGGFEGMRLSALVPESHTIFFCPPGCGRHTAISAIQNHYMDQTTYVLFNDEELSLGLDNEDIVDTVIEVLSELERKPKALFVYFCCVSYLIGVDEEMLLDMLREKKKDVVFQVLWMNPICLGTSTSPGITTYQRIFQLSDMTSEQTNSLNFIGGGKGIDRDCEIYEVLRKFGVGEINHFSETTTFEEFRKLGKARWNIAIRPAVREVVESLSERMDYRVLKTTYDIDIVEKQYSEIFSMFGNSCDMTEYKKRTKELIKRALKKIGDKRIAIGSSATMVPYDMARSLIRYGFNVTDVFCAGMPMDDSYQWLIDNTSIKISNIANKNMMDRKGKCGNADIAIGFSAGFFSGAESVADISMDNGIFGYQGIQKLMKLLEESVKSPMTLESLAEKGGLVII